MDKKEVLIFPLILGMLLLGIGISLVILFGITRTSTDLAGAAVAIVGANTPLNKSGIYERWKF